MKYLGRPKVCCANCQQWFDSKPFSDGRWGKCRAIGAPNHKLSTEKEESVSTFCDFWCCNFRLKVMTVKLRISEEIEMIEI